MCVVVVPPLKIPWADDKEIEDLLSDVNVEVGLEEATSHCTVWSPVLISCRFTRKNPGFPPIQTSVCQHYKRYQAMPGSIPCFSVAITARKEIKIKIKSMKFLA